MAEREEMSDIAYRYDPENITIGVLGSHSAEEVGIAAASLGLTVVVACQKGRDELYSNQEILTHEKI